MKNKISYIVFALLVLIGNQNVCAQIISKESIVSPDNMTVQKIFYNSDQLKVSGYILKPKEGKNFPIIISNRGGSFHWGALTDTTAIEYNKFLVNAGYIVFASNYRGNMGSEGKEEWGSGDVSDVLNLLEIAVNYPDVDSTKVGMYGWSRGSMVTYNVLRKTSKIKAAVAGADDGNIYEGYLEDEFTRNYFDRIFKYFWPDEEEKKKRLKAISLYYFTEELHPTPLLMLHGSDDDRSLARLAIKTVDKLLENNHPVSFKLYNGGGHNLDEFNKEVDRDIIEWFDRYLKK